MEAQAQPEARLAILSAGTRSARAASRGEAENLIDGVDWAALAAGLRTRRLLGRLGERILAIAGGRAPEWFAAVTREEIAKGAQQESMLALISLQIMHSFAAAGIPSLPLKGPLLGEAIYGGAGRRPASDIDLLVASEDLSQAIEVATRTGYQPPHDQIWCDELPMLHFGLSHERRALPSLELHWRIHWYEHEFSRDVLMRSAADRARGRRAALADEFTSLLLFYARDGFVDLRLACDIGAWWDAFGAELPNDAVDEVVDRYPALERTLLAALTVTDRVVGVPSLTLLGRSRPLDARVRLAARLANPMASGTPQQRSADVWLVDWLLTPPGGRLECIRRQLSVGNKSPGATRVRPLAAVDRGARLLRRHTVSLIRIARRAVRERAAAIRRSRVRPAVRGASAPCSRR